LHKSYTLIIKLLIATIFFAPANLFSQNQTIEKNRNVWKLNDSSYLFKEDTIKELWHIDKSLDIWKLNEFIEILTYNNNKLRIWHQGLDASLWYFDKEIKDWKLKNLFLIDKQTVNDTIQFSIVNDSTKLVFNNSKLLMRINSQKLIQ